MAKQDDERELAALRMECEQLRAENARLREELSKLGVSAPIQPPDRNTAATEQRSRPSVNSRSSAEAKVALFRSLFRGREDVYAV
jgi:hypothetical protein